MFGLLKKLVFLMVPQWRFMNTYSQSGEDCIMYYFFSMRGIRNPSYLDIGTNEPIYGNNTFLFYKRGSRGVCVEADPSLIPEIQKKRGKDICINAGVTFDNRSSADFYIFEEPGINTLSGEEAKIRMANEKVKLKKILPIPLMNINTIIETHFKSPPNIISIDIEGMDFEVIKSLDFSKHAPDMICIETVTFSLDNTGKKIDEINTFLQTKSYSVYGDTYINTIFVQNKYLSH